MGNVTRHIGLSLGADICWPICYEEILKRLDLAIPIAGDTVRFEVERVTIEPFNLRQAVKYDLVIDRLTHWYHTSREWIKKAVIMDGLYVFNNPWSVQSMEKHSTYCAMMHLGMPIPETWMLPPKAYEQLPDLQPTLRRYAKLFDLGAVGKAVGYPAFMKPYENMFQKYVRHEVVSAIRMDCHDAEATVMVGGASIGAFHAVAAVCRWPNVFTHALAASGTYMLERFYKADHVTEDFVVSSPHLFVPTLGGQHLDMLRSRFILLVSGEGRAEDISESWNLAHILGAKRIPNRVDSWGPEWHHDWPTWRKMMPQYLAEWTQG